MIRVRQVKVLAQNKSLENIKLSVAKKLHIEPSSILELNISKESIDARKKHEIYFVYEVDIKINDEEKFINSSKDIIKTPNLQYKVEATGEYLLNYKPIIVGSGPSGLFAALNLAENGIKPIIIEQGKCIDERIKDVEEFINNNKLNKMSNIQFGEGGAGTFSDGKLNTLIKDTENRGRKVFETFIECGADSDILYSYKPHIGTDILRGVIKSIRKKIENLGGVFLFNTKLTDIIINDNKLEAIEVNNSEIIKTEVLVLAIGNSSRDTFRMLNNKLNMTSKPFAVGLRIMHPQKLIDEIQFGEYADLLHPATYKLTYQTKSNRGVYTFCMCPGGYVINASSEDKHLVINGMSYHKRDSGIANSAIVVTVNKEDFGNDVLSGIEYQEELEEKCYNLCNGLIPVQKLKDFYDNKISDKLDNLCIEGKYASTNLNELLPSYIRNSIKEAINNYNTKMVGFKSDDALLAGIETRTSSPIRILRDDVYVSSIAGIYPTGEGAGYAGGITSSAIDGLRVSEAILKVYKEGNYEETY